MPIATIMSSLQWRKYKYWPHQNRNYAMSKAGNWLLASEFAARVADDGIVSLTQNPGNLRTKIWDKAPNWPRSCPALFCMTQSWGLIRTCGRVWQTRSRSRMVAGMSYPGDAGICHRAKLLWLGSRARKIQALERRRGSGTGVRIRRRSMRD
jgi:NAD(P)-dependent dehydrogenase (short-subunit alcohol dehydrogenase family)